MFSFKFVPLFLLEKMLRDNRAELDVTDDGSFLCVCSVGGLRSGLPGTATDQLQAVGRAQRSQGQTGHPARAETGMSLESLEHTPIRFSFFLTFPQSFILSSFFSATIPAGHEVCLHPGLLVGCVHLDREKVSASGPSCRLKTGSGDLLHAAPSQTCLCDPQPGGN